jgi:hypothetical protein
MKIPMLLAALVTGAALSAQATLYSGSGFGGFGDPVSGSTMEWSDDGTTVTVDFTKGSGDFNDTLVIYLNNGSGGRSAIGTDVNDRADTNRAGISYLAAATGNNLTFNAGMEATHAIAINTGFGGLWSIPASGTVGDNGLGFVTAVGNPTTSTQSSFTFTFDLADIGLAPNSGATIDFVATYLNPFGGTDNHGFVSNEGYGGGFPGSNIGQDDFTFTSNESYTTIPEPETLLMLFAGLGLIAWLRRRK